MVIWLCCFWACGRNVSRWELGMKELCSTWWLGTGKRRRGIGEGEEDGKKEGGGG